MKNLSLLNQLSIDLMMPSKRLNRVINNAPLRYKEYNIPKRSKKGYRTIAQPAKEVKVLQQWVVQNILKKFEVHSSAKAYREGINILSNALPHSSSSYMIKIDFKNFFYSIKANDFMSFLKSKKNNIYSEEDIKRLIMILFYRKGNDDLCLSIGAPSSPLLSNIIMYGFDEIVNNYCVEKDIIYTRYSDDITFSMNESSLRYDVYNKVCNVLSDMIYPKLELNKDKTIVSSKANKRIVTGLVLKNDGGVSIGRDKKRLIRSQIYRLSKGILDEGEINGLRGMIAYVKSVEPEFVDKMRKKYGSLNVF